MTTRDRKYNWAMYSELAAQQADAEALATTLRMAAEIYHATDAGTDDEDLARTLNFWFDIRAGQRARADDLRANADFDTMISNYYAEHGIGKVD